MMKEKKCRDCQTIYDADLDVCPNCSGSDFEEYFAPHDDYYINETNAQKEDSFIDKCKKHPKRSMAVIVWLAGAVIHTATLILHNHIIY